MVSLRIPRAKADEKAAAEIAQREREQSIIALDKSVSDFLNGRYRGRGPDQELGRLLKRAEELGINLEESPRISPRATRENLLHACEDYRSRYIDAEKTALRTILGMDGTRNMRGLTEKEIGIVNSSLLRLTELLAFARADYELPDPLIERAFRIWVAGELPALEYQITKGLRSLKQQAEGQLRATLVDLADQPKLSVELVKKIFDRYLKKTFDRA